jgi:hypothetical protein
MIIIMERILSKDIENTRTILRGNKGRGETSHHFSETILKENHLLESTEWLR